MNDIEIIRAATGALKDFRVCQARRVDPVLDEICWDLETLLRDLGALGRSDDGADADLRRDILETLRALIFEVRTRLDRAACMKN